MAELGFHVMSDAVTVAIAEEAARCQQQWLELWRGNLPPPLPHPAQSRFIGTISLLLDELIDRLEIPRKGGWAQRSMMLQIGRVPAYLYFDPLTGQVSVYVFPDGPCQAVDEARETQTIDLSKSTLLAAVAEKGATEGKMLFHLPPNHFADCVWNIVQHPHMSGIPETRFRVLTPNRAFRWLRLHYLREAVAEAFPHIYRGLDTHFPPQEQPENVAQPEAAPAPQTPPQPQVQMRQQQPLAQRPQPRDSQPLLSAHQSTGADTSSVDYEPIEPSHQPSWVEMQYAIFGKDVVRTIENLLARDNMLTVLFKRLNLVMPPDSRSQHAELRQFLNQYGAKLFVRLASYDYSHEEIERRKVSRLVGWGRRELADDWGQQPMGITTGSLGELSDLHQITERGLKPTTILRGQISGSAMRSVFQRREEQAADGDAPRDENTEAEGNPPHPDAHEHDQDQDA